MNEATSWKQFKIKTNLGTLVSVFIAVGLIMWQLLGIKGNIDSNSESVHNLQIAIEDLSYATDLANQVSMRTDQLFDQLNMIQDQSQDSAFAWADIQMHSQQISDLSFDVDELEWQLDDVKIRQAEAGGHLNEPIFQEIDGLWNAINNLGTGGFEEWEFDELENRIVAVETTVWNQGDSAWEIDELDTRLTVLETTLWNQPDNRWEIDELLRRVNELEWFTYG